LKKLCPQGGEAQNLRILIFNDLQKASLAASAGGKVGGAQSKDLILFAVRGAAAEVGDRTANI
jgi:hypothetical protein